MTIFQERSYAPRTNEVCHPSPTVWHWIENQAEATPRRTAILDGEVEITYERLVERANAIAGELVARRVEPGSLVGVCMGRSWELLATLVGVLRAGCAYVPLDPAYPKERVRYMLEHSRAAVAIVDSESLAELCVDGPEILRLDEVGEWTAEGIAGPAASDLAYVMYTSGSTGRPKGVAVEHRNVVPVIRSMASLVGDQELEGVLAAASICFDASIIEIFGTLSLGGTVVLARNVLALAELPAADRVRMCVMVPSAMRAVLAAGALPGGIRCIFIGGEALTRPLADQLLALESKPRLVNVYGPTEVTVYSTTAEIRADGQPITIGQPVDGTRAHILDASLLPVAPGEVGELYMAGDQLARGYLHQEELTRERFIEMDPAGSIPEARLYKTGDACRWREDGNIEFLGRLDQQVKIRGFRIELEEIESTLEALDGVDGAAVAVVEGAGGYEMLVGYIVTRDGAISGQVARAHLARHLPEYMVPRVILGLDALPRLPNDKLDRKALPKPEKGLLLGAGEGRATSSAVVSDSQGLGHRLASLSRDQARAALIAAIKGEIASILGSIEAEDVPADRSFYDLGLDSLTTVELSSRLSVLLGVELAVSEIMERSTAVGLADQLIDSVGGAAASAESVPAPEARAQAADTLASFQAQIQACYPPFLAAKAAAWSATDKGIVVRELKHLVGHEGRDSFSKLVRTGSGKSGVVADMHTDEERQAIIWTTNLYLGLNRDPEVIAEARSAVERLGTGMGTSAAAAGVTDLHMAFEKGFAELVGKPAACLFPTGYTANVGAVAGLLGKGDVVVMDQLCHASIVDGARLCGAKIRTFQHNNVKDLESVLEAEASPYRTILVVFEGVYSMGEGAAPVAELVRAAKKYRALVLVDEAHSFGFYGPRGGGICAAQGVSEEVDFVMTTLSKALGSLGGVVAASKEHVDLLKSSSRAYIFQASTSPADMAAAVTSLGRIRDDDSLRQRLWDTTAYMRQRFTEAGYELGKGDTPIVTPHFGDREKLFAIVSGLYERGIHTSAVTYPIVEMGRGRLRFICSAAHTREDVDRTVEALIEAEREVDEALAKARAAREASAELGSGLSDAEAWARDFARHLEQAVVGATAPVPSLAIDIGLVESEEPITLTIEDRAVAVRAPGEKAGERADLPSCSLRLGSARALSALCSSDVQGLLDSLIDGECVVNGRVEPFIWLMARMVEQSQPVSD